MLSPPCPAAWHSLNVSHGGCMACVWKDSVGLGGHTILEPASIPGGHPLCRGEADSAEHCPETFLRRCITSSAAHPCSLCPGTCCCSKGCEVWSHCSCKSVHFSNTPWGVTALLGLGGKAWELGEAEASRGSERASVRGQRRGQHRQGMEPRAVTVPQWGQAQDPAVTRPCFG